LVFPGQGGRQDVDRRPSAVLTIDSRGIPTVRFVQAGHIYVMDYLSNASGRYLLAGGINNEYNAASMAVIPADAPPSRSPQTVGSRFERIDGPKWQPDRYFLFPLGGLDWTSCLSRLEPLLPFLCVDLQTHENTLAHCGRETER
jgi:hypothetical protein